MTQVNIADILIGQGGNSLVYLSAALANRHGLIAGATGTGKTISLQVLAEGFSQLGVPVFMADIKGDLTGISQAGSAHPKITERVESIGIKDHAFTAFPTLLWDLNGELGHPIRATISDMGPLLLSRLLDLNDTQEGILNMAFQLSDDEGLLLLDFKDLRAILMHMGENRKDLQNRYGNMSSASIGAIQRRLLVLEQQGAENFFAEPALDLQDLMRVDENGYGYINILAAEKLMLTPRLYTGFLLWLMAELFENLPEVGDQAKPKMVFFFDEAHLLFDNAPKVLLERIEQVVKLIRSKGVGIYFITQNPTDIPDAVLGQLGNRIQHALRAFTPKDQKALRVAAQTFRPNPELNTEAVIAELGVGEALVSVLLESGIPSMVQRTLICPPSSRMGPISEQERMQLLEASPLAGRYESILDRESAYELLQERALQAAVAANRENTTGANSRFNPGSVTSRSAKAANRQTVSEAFMKSVARSVGSRLGQQIVRGVLGSLFRGR